MLTLNVNAPDFPCLTADPSASSGDSTIPNCDLASPDPVGAGALRFTSTAEQHASGLVAETSLPTSQGLDITFTQYQYGGYGLGGPGSPGGADGISFFLAVAPPSPTVLGPQGGALGYASAGSSPGLPGAWLGIGLDAFGNFSNPGFGSPSCPAKSWAGFNPDSVTVRGPGHGLNGYCLLASSADPSASASSEWPGLSAIVYAEALPTSLRGPDRASSARDIRIQLTPDDGLFRVYVDDGSGPTLATSGALPTSYYDPQTGALVSGLPPRVTFGFAASTGSATDIHEISDLVATTASGAVPVLELTKTASSSSVSAGQAFSYTLTPSIAGTTAETQPQTLRVSDNLPSGLTLSGTPSGTSWLCATSSSTAFSCSYTAAGAIPAGTTLPSIMVPVILGSGVPNGTSIVNTATALSADAAAPVFATATVSVTSVPPLTITTTSLPGGTVGTSYGATVAATGGTGARTWSLASGALPAGLTLSAAGAINGTPTASGTAAFTVRVTDAAAATTTRALSIVVAPASTPLVITTTSLPRGTVGQSYSAPLQASGGTGPYNWSRDSGTLPPGLTTSTSGLIGGTPTTAGVFTVFVRVTAANGATTARGFNLQVVPAPVVVTTTNLPPGEVTLPYAAALAATGGVAPFTWTFVGGTLPAGLALSQAGVIAGTPTAAGTSVFWVRATDSTGRTDGQRLTITILPRLTITTTSLPAGRVGTAYSRTLVRTGGLAPFTWTIASGSLPAGLTLSSAGVISGTPTTAGTVNFTVRVRDALNVAATRALSVGIAASATEKAYLASGRVDQREVIVVDLGLGQIVKKIPVARAVGSVASHNGARVYVWRDLNVGIDLINPVTDTVTGSVAFPNWQFIQDVKVSPDDRRLYVLVSRNDQNSPGGFAGSLLVLNAATLGVVRTFSLNGGANLALSPDGLTAYVSMVTPERLYRLVALSTSDGAVIGSRSIPFYFYQSLVTPSGSRLVASRADGGTYMISQYSLPDLTEVARVTVPSAQFYMAGVDNSFVYTADYSYFGSGTVRAIELATGAVRHTSLGRYAVGMAIDASRQYGYSVGGTSYDQLALMKIDLSSLAVTRAAELPLSDFNLGGGAFEFGIGRVGP